MTHTKQQKLTTMTTTILASKTGQTNMGGYFKVKTAQVFQISYDGIELKNWFRFRYVGDSCDECFETIEQAMNKFNQACLYIN